MRFVQQIGVEGRALHICIITLEELPHGFTCDVVDLRDVACFAAQLARLHWQSLSRFEGGATRRRTLTRRSGPSQTRKRTLPHLELRRCVSSRGGGLVSPRALRAR